MFAAPSEERSHDGAYQTRVKDITRSGSKVKRKVHSAEVTLPPLCQEQPSLSAAFTTRRLFSPADIVRNVPCDRPLSVVELPRLIAQVGPGRAIAETKWTEGPRLMASSLGTHIPIRTADESTDRSLTERAEAIKVTTCKDKRVTTTKTGKAIKLNKVPLTGTEVAHIFAKKRDLAELELYYLKEVDGDSYRPYDLQVVHSSEAGPEHYIFSPDSVLHVTERGYGGLISLAEWYRESVLWTALQEIPFFRNFRLRKAFTWFRRSVREIIFQRKCENLQDMLIIAVPQFRNALFLFTRILEELKGTHRLPQEECQTYTLLEFKNALTTMNQEWLQILKKLSQYYAAILYLVKEDSYEAHQELRRHLGCAEKPNKSCEPIHLHLAHQQELKRELARSESILQKLGNFAALVNQIIVQSLVTTVRQDVISFLENISKRKNLQQCCLFHTELCFSSSSQLTVDPPIYLFQEAVSEALLNVGRSVIQMCDTSGFFSEISDRVCCSGFTPDLTSDLSCTEDPTVAGEIKNNDGVTDGRKFCCGLRLTDPSFRWLVVPKQTLLRVQGTRVHGCYHPLPKRQLEWQISINDIAKQVENEQAKIMQEAELEIQQLCKSYVWLMDVHLLIQGWNRASLESMMGQPALQYDEHIKRVHHWREKISIMPSSISLSNRLFIIQTTHIKEYLGKQLDSIEDELLEQLVEQIKLRSESVMSDLERATAELKTEHRDLHYFSKYALTVRKSEKMLADTQKCLEYIHSLQDIICKNYRKLTKEEVALEEKMLGTWDNFIPCLKQAESVVLQHRPSVANALDTIFSGLAHDLKDIISKTTSGSFLDPTRNPKEMVSTLNHTCAHVHSLMAKLEQLSNNSENLQEHPMDLTSLTTDIQKVKARKELWELRAVHTTWMEEWKLLLFSEALVSDAQEKLATWKEQALALTSIIATDDAVLQETLGILESLSCQLAVMAKLQSPTLKQKHWKAIFEGMGLLYVPENKVTVAELMSQPLEVHQSFISKICRDALAEYNMERTFQKLQQRWEARLFQMDKFTLPVWQYCGPQHVSAETDKPTEGPVSNLQAASQHCSNDARFTVTGVEILLAELEDNVMTLSAMLKSPHSVELRLQMENWLTSLQELGKLLHLFERYQQTWAFLRKMFHETFSAQKLDLMEQFKPVDETFKDIMDFLSNDLHVLNFVHSKRTDERLHGKSLCQILTDGLSTMEGISNQMVDFLDTLCEQFPRVWFLSHREVIQLLSFRPTALTLQTFVCRCFKGVRWLEVDCEIASNTRDVKSCCAQISQSHKQMKVLGLFGSFGEHVTFLSPLEPNQNAMEWLRVFGKQFKLTMIQLMKQCAVVQNQLEPSRQDLACEKKFGDILHQMVDRRNFALPVLDLLSKCPLQCVLVTEEAVWCKVVQQTIQVSSPVKLSNIKTYNAAKLRTLGCVIRESLVSKYIMICLQALVQLTMNHAQQLSRLMEVEHVALESSFEWLSLMKYHLNSEDRSSKASDDLTCYVDVLDHRFQYDHEYFGPDDLVMVHTPSTDRAVLGILLALTRYRSGFVSGPSMSGKNKTVVQLGKALGRQVVCIRCCRNMRPGVVQRMLLGALQTGAWLLLDSVDLLTQGGLALLGQHLMDIHHALSGFTRNRKQRVNEEAMDRTADGKNIDSGCQMLLAERSICANLNYGCVLISSKGYTSEVPESLRYATRPIGLTHPDHRIIAEVMLTSIGFSEAVSLSRHLVCLIGQAKDARCLPDFISDDRSCDLVVLQKIISASETHLKQLVKQREISNEAKGLAAEHTDDRSQNVTAKDVEDVEKDKEETEKLSRLCISDLSIIQGIMEETAIVKAIISVIIPFLYEHKKTSQFYQIFKDTFPISCQFPLSQQYIVEEEKNQLKDAIIEELERKLLRSDSEIICSALTLYQTMKFSQGVVLVGPSGSGKTTCYCALAGALNQLAAKATDMFGNDCLIEGDDQQAERQTSALNWNSINTVVLFPNAMSHEEVFGCFCEKRGWQDGAVVKALRDSERLKPRSSTVTNTKSNQPLVVKWLVMDGNPVGQPGWLDHLTTLCSPEDPFLCLSSGEILPSHSQVKLLMEISDLSAASPSVVTRCSLVYLTGSDLWKAVWKSETDNLSSEKKLEKETLKIWNRLSDDLFPNTLDFLRQKEKSLKNTVHGLQEIMSFFRILRALLQHFENELEKAEAIPQIDRDLLLHRAATAGTDLHSKQELLTRNLFLVAYIWGFSGHLHPRHWPQFDVLARRELFTCRYKIVIPDEDSVFDHFFNIDSKICPKNTLTNSITPKYGKYTYLLNLMLEAKQPVLLVGEPASGKTTLCKSLLSFERPHISLPASPLLKSRDLRTLLSNINCQKSGEDTRGSMSKQPGLLLFVDDLHEAPCDVYGKTSAALETLRQSISKGEIVTFGNNHFKSLRSGLISYMATCCVFGLGSHHSNVISSRLSRLFSIFVLPCLSMDIIFSIHSPWLKIWLKDMPLKQSCDDVARCIITATESLYRAVCDRFQPAVQKPHFMFSHHDLQKVFLGMYLWQPNITSKETMHKKESSVPGFQPGPAASLCNIVQLWMHECMRTFGDRLCSEDESKTLMSLIAKMAATHYGIGLVDETQPVGVGDPSTVTSPDISTLPGNTSEPTSQSVETSHLHEEQMLADQSHTTKGQTLTKTSLHTEDASQKTQPQILRCLESAQAKLVFGPELTEALKSESQKINIRCSFSYEDRDLDVLLQEVCALIDKKEEGKADDDYNSTTRYIVHRQRVNQLLHILRVLLISGGHGVLIGSDRGTGRKTTVRLAAFVTGYQLVEVHPGNESDLHDILKQAGNQTRMDGVNVIILVHEGISQSAREELLVAMAHRTYPGLYTDEELRNLVCRMTAVRKSRRCFMASWMFEKVLSKVHRNVHVFLLLPLTMPSSSEITSDNATRGWNAQLTKALTLSCCVEVYHPWSTQSLQEVAAQCLKTGPHKVGREGSEALCVAMAGIHQSACQYASALLRTQPFSPQTYMEFIAHFGSLCNHLHKQRQSQANRVATVLSHVDVMNSTAVQYKQLCKRLQKEAAEMQQHEKELLTAVHHRRGLLEEATETCVAKERKLYQMEEQINYAQKQVKPLFLFSLKILNCLNPSDLEEIRHYRDPPDGVVKILDAICLLFNRPPGWDNAKQLLGQPNFFQELEFFDRNTLTGEQLQQLGLIVHSPQFVPESVREVSKACESLCRWVQAVYEWCCMQHHLLAKQHLEQLAREAQGQLHLAKEHMEDTCHCLEDAELQLELVQEELEERLLELRTAERAATEAVAAVEQLETHGKNWRAAAQEAELNNQTLPGDALILAAIISYLGPFGPDVRTELLSKWKELSQTGSISTSPRDSRASLFTHSDAAPSHPRHGFPIPVSERLQLPLSQVLGTLQCLPSARTVVKLLMWGSTSSWVQRWPLLADTQQHLEISSQRQLITGERARLDKETECELVVCADDPELLDKLDQASEKGLRVLLTHLERAVPSPEFLSRLVRPAGCFSPGLKQHFRQSHPDFCLFLSTHLPVELLNDEIHPSILAQVRVVDLSVGSEELQELMLTQLLQSAECKNLLTRHLQIQNDKQLLQEKLVAEEGALMDYILQSNTSLLQDPDFPPLVAVCQEAMKKLQIEIQQLSEELEYHESLLASPRQLTKLAAALYLALQQVARLSPAYYFSLYGFIAVMQEASTIKGGSLVSYNKSKVPEGLIQEMTNRMVVQLLVQYRPCLSKSHFAVLKLLVSVTLLQHNQLCSEAEKVAFLRGLQDLENPPSAAQSSSALPSWIPSHIHPELICLDKIPAFRGLIASLSSCPNQWQEYLHFPSSSVVGSVPCRSHSHLSLLQRALLWKTMVPECLEGLAEAMAVYHLCLPGQAAGTDAPHTGNPEALSRHLDKHKGPIILTLPNPRGDKWTSIHPLHLINKLAHCVAERKFQVEVVSFGALCDAEDILSKLHHAAHDGHWIVFNNCHLLDQWDDKVVAHLSHLSCSLKEERWLLHPSFRLWFITHEHASRSIPAAVRVVALPLVCDSPWDLKEELSCSLRQAASFIQCHPLSGVTADNVELLLRGAIFHSVLLQRQTYKYSGQGTIYSWTQEDLLTLMDAHIRIASLCHDKKKALQYFAVNIVHGGHVLDSADLQVVESVADTCFSSVPPLWRSGPHILSNVISNPGHFDLTRQLQILEHSLRGSLNVDDALVLGFGADVSAEMIKINSHNLNILLQASQTPAGTVNNLFTHLKRLAPLPAYSHAKDRLQTLKSYLAHRSGGTDANAGAASHSPLRDFLQAEWDELIDSVSSLLSLLHQPVQCGTPTFASLLELTDLSHLERKAELLSAYLGHHSTSDPPGAYRLAAFKNARGFLAAMARGAAEVNRKYISDIDLHFQVVSDSTHPATLPLDSVYLCGLELRGASWDWKQGAIQDSASLQQSSLPLVCVKAQVSSTNNARNSSTTKRSDIKDSNNVKVGPQLPLYHCPLYLDGGQESGNWGLADVNIVTTLPLSAKLHPVLCSLRRVRLVSVL